MYTSKVNIGRDICEIKSSQCQILPTSLLPSIASGQWSTQRQRGKHVESTARDQESIQTSAIPRGVVTVTSKFGKLRVGWRLLTIIWYFYFTTQVHYILID